MCRVVFSFQKTDRFLNSRTNVEANKETDSQTAAHCWGAGVVIVEVRAVSWAAFRCGDTSDGDTTQQHWYLSIAILEDAAVIGPALRNAIVMSLDASDPPPSSPDVSATQSLRFKGA